MCGHHLVGMGSWSAFEDSCPIWATWSAFGHRLSHMGRLVCLWASPVPYGSPGQCLVIAWSAWAACSVCRGEVSSGKVPPRVSNKPCTAGTDKPAQFTYRPISRLAASFRQHIDQEPATEVAGPVWVTRSEWATCSTRGHRLSHMGRLFGVWALPGRHGSPGQRMGIACPVWAACSACRGEVSSGKVPLGINNKPCTAGTDKPAQFTYRPNWPGWFIHRPNTPSKHGHDERRRARWVFT